MSDSVDGSAAHRVAPQSSESQLTQRWTDSNGEGVPPGEPTSEVHIRVGRVPLWREVALAVLLLMLTLTGLFGLLYVARGEPVHGVVVEGMRALPPVVDDPLFARAMELTSGAQLTAGNDVQLMLNGDGTFPQMWEDIRSARRSLTVQMYYFTPGELADSLGANLTDRARAGVRVLLLLDAFGAREVPPVWIDGLRAEGVDVEYLRPLQWSKLVRLTHRSHVRSVVVDGEVGYTGGFGLGDYWLGDGRSKDRWRETNVRMAGPAVLQLQAAFMAGWAEATGELLTGDLYFPAEQQSSGDVQAGVLYFAPTMGSAAAERFLALAIAAARGTLYLTNSYFVPDVQFRRMLIDAARRGVDVRVLTAGDETDIPMTLYAARARYEELLRGGVRIYEYQPTMMHAKTLVVDGTWATVGSLNFDNRSISYNDEANAVVLDARFGAAMNTLFMRDIELSREVRLEEFLQRPLWQKWFEFGANLVSDIL